MAGSVATYSSNTAAVTSISVVAGTLLTTDESGGYVRSNLLVDSTAPSRESSVSNKLTIGQVNDVSRLIVDVPAYTTITPDLVDTYVGKPVEEPNGYLDKSGLTYLWGKLKAFFQEKLVSGSNIKTVNNQSLLGSGNINIEGGGEGGGAKSELYYGAVDSTSTSTEYTATISGLTELKDGTTVMLHNGVVTSAAGFTVNINGLGAKKCYNNMTNATQETTVFNAAYTMMFVYASSLDGGNGGFWIYRGYDSNTNTIGYQLRTNSTTKTAKNKGYNYRLWFTSADDKQWVPANVSTSTNATTARTANSTPIDPFGPIIYSSHNTTYNAGAKLNAGYQWTQYPIALGYSFTDSLPLADNTPVYVKCSPQSDGSAVMKGTTKALPSSKDGFIYIYLGQAYNTTNIELRPEHPVYWHDGTGIRLWTGAEPSSGGASPSYSVEWSDRWMIGPSHVVLKNNAAIVDITGVINASNWVDLVGVLLVAWTGEEPTIKTLNDIPEGEFVYKPVEVELYSTSASASASVQVYNTYGSITMNKGYDVGCIMRNFG